MIRRLLLTPAVLAAVGCAATDQAPMSFDQLAPPPEAVAVVEEAPAPLWNPPRMRTRRVAGHLIRTFRFEENAIYDVPVGPPGTATTLRFGEHEQVQTSAISTETDNKVWGAMVRHAGKRDVATVSAGDDGRDMVTMVFNSTQATYQVNFVRVPAEKRVEIVDWDYPPVAKASQTVARGCQIDTAGLNIHGWAIKVGGDTRPAWTPASIGDDGRRTVIGFTADVGSLGVPPLFAATANGVSAPIPTRPCGRFLEIDQVLTTAEFRRGDATVRLVKGAN